MPQPRDVSRYPAEFLELAQKFQASPLAIAITCTSNKAAMRMRFKLYGFKDAIRSQEGMKEMFTAFLATEVTISGSTLTIRMPEDSQEAAAIREALRATVAGEEGGVSAPAHSSQAHFPSIPAAGTDTSASEMSIDDFLKKED